MLCGVRPWFTLSDKPPTFISPLVVFRVFYPPSPVIKGGLLGLAFACVLYVKSHPLTGKTRPLRARPRTGKTPYGGFFLIFGAKEILRQCAPSERPVREPHRAWHFSVYNTRADQSGSQTVSEVCRRSKSILDQDWIVSGPNPLGALMGRSAGALVGNFNACAVAWGGISSPPVRYIRRLPAKPPAKARRQSSYQTGSVGWGADHKSCFKSGLFRSQPRLGALTGRSDGAPEKVFETV